MWWSRALLLLAVMALGPAACGFQPLYGERENHVVAGLSSVHVNSIEDRIGQQLRNNLVERMQPKGPTKYRLSATLDESAMGLGQRRDATATVGRLSMSATYTLTDAVTGDAVLAGRAESVVSFNFLGPRYASVAAERDSQERALADLADQITGRVATYLKQTESR